MSEDNKPKMKPWTFDGAEALFERVLPVGNRRSDLLKIVQMLRAIVQEVNFETADPSVISDALEEIESRAKTCAASFRKGALQAMLQDNPAMVERMPCLHCLRSIGDEEYRVDEEGIVRHYRCLK